VDLILGYRYYRLSDGVIIREDLVAGAAPPPGVAPGTAFLIQDSFKAWNDFHGTEIGFASRCMRGQWSLDLVTKMAIGNNRQTVVIDGSTRQTPPGGPSQLFDVGILAGGSNEGRYTRDSFAIIPQLSADLGLQWNRHFKTYMGYTIIYWADVVRAGEQIELAADTGNFPPAVANALPFPAYPGRTTGYWAQGVNLGAEWRY
jgi:hypothetical protein